MLTKCVELAVDITNNDDRDFLAAREGKKKSIKQCGYIRENIETYEMSQTLNCPVSSTYERENKKQQVQRRHNLRETLFVLEN